MSKAKRIPADVQVAQALVQSFEKENTEKSELPIITSIGLVKIPNQDHESWVVVTIMSQGDKIISTEMTEPNMKAIAVDSGKIAFVKLFVRGEG